MNAALSKVVLSIDTSRYDKLVVGVDSAGEKKVIEEEFDFRKSQGVLPLIEKVLHEEHVEFVDLAKIEVTTGPGSFTGLRVGTAIANTLGTILQIPLNQQAIGEIVTPIYS
ncbi:MAG TPA: hypothetical protein VG935_04405 [Patescibacteria group bacterium]|nr:hypothetical protein [Patescibacteria group bacterium]